MIVHTSRPVATRLRKPAAADGISRYPVCFALRRFIAAFLHLSGSASETSLDKGGMQDCKCGFDAEPGSLITRREIFLSRYGYFGIRFISATKDFFFAVISTHAGRKPLLIAFLTDFRLDHAAQ